MMESPFFCNRKLSLCVNRVMLRFSEPIDNVSGEHTERKIWKTKEAFV